MSTTLQSSSGPSIAEHEPLPIPWNRLALVFGVFAVGFLILYWHVANKLISDWASDGNYSHGFLIIPISAYLAWERRDQLLRTPLKPSNLGLVGVLGSVAVLAAGTLGAELFLTRVSLIGVVASSVVFLLGWQHLRVLAFPIGFLILMVPLPAIIFNQIAFPLQMLASEFGERSLAALKIPVLREGNVIILAHTKLEVVEACSGIRSLVSLITLATVYGYFIDKRFWMRALIVVSAIPVAIFANGLRIAGTGIAAHYYGPEAAQGFFHEFSGWVVFVVAFAAMFGLRHILASLEGMTARRWPRGATA